MSLAPCLQPPAKTWHHLLRICCSWSRCFNRYTLLFIGKLELQHMKVLLLWPSLANSLADEQHLQRCSILHGGFFKKSVCFILLIAFSSIVDIDSDVAFTWCCSWTYCCSLTLQMRAWAACICKWCCQECVHAAGGAVKPGGRLVIQGWMESSVCLTAHTSGHTHIIIITLVHLRQFSSPLLGLLISLLWRIQTMNHKSFNDSWAMLWVTYLPVIHCCD